jgi:hypothetical protein
MPTFDVRTDDVGKGFLRRAHERLSPELDWMPFILKLNANLVPITPIEDFRLKGFNRDLEPVLSDVLL